MNKLRVLLVLGALLCWPAWAQAAVYWDDEMESGNTGFSLPAGPMSFDTAVKHSGSGSVRYNSVNNGSP